MCRKVYLNFFISETVLYKTSPYAILIPTLQHDTKSRQFDEEFSYENFLYENNKSV